MASEGVRAFCHNDGPGKGRLTLGVRNEADPSSGSNRKTDGRQICDKV